MFIRDLNKFCSACIKGCVIQHGFNDFSCITADPGVLDKDALVEAVETVAKWDCWIWNGCTMVVFTPVLYDIPG